MKRKAFSMLELIFVIIILGVVASVGSEMIANIYENYIVQRAQHRASTKTELAATQIANRLASAIPGTVFRRQGFGAADILEGINDTMTAASSSYTVLQWVGRDTDSFAATATPGWSGFCDINASTSTSISTPGSNLATTQTIIDNLSVGGQTPYVYFPSVSNTAYATTGALAGTTLNLAGAAPVISEHYKLAWSSYALQVKANGDLVLLYDFTATPGIDMTNATESLLMKNVTTFKFKGSGNTIRFKICRSEDIGDGFNVTSCKEKAVF